MAIKIAMKKTLAIFLAALGILGAAVSCEEKPIITPPSPQQPSEQETPEDGQVRISNIGELEAFLKSGKGNAILVCDLDANGADIAAAVYFTGKLDGKGFSIKKLGGNSHLCGINKGTVCNLTLEGQITPNPGAFGVVANINIGTVSNVCSRVSITASYTDNDNYLGGIVGQMSGGEITGCTYSGTIDVNATGGKTYVGGICGYWAGGEAMKECCNNGDISSGTTLNGMGGLTGLIGTDGGKFGDGCRVDCKISNKDTEQNFTGMVVGCYAETAKESCVGRLSDPVFVNGSISFGTGEIDINAANLDSYTHGKSGWNSAKCQIIAIANGEEIPEEHIWSEVVRATTSTVAIAWTLDESRKDIIGAPHAGYDCEGDLGKAYRLELYSDYACSNLMVAWNIPADFYTKTYPPRFIFSGLAPESKYYVKILNVTDATAATSPLAIKTEAPITKGLNMAGSSVNAGDCILAESFDKMLWGGDMTTMSAGYSRNDRASLKSIAAGTASGDDPVAHDSNFYLTDGSVEMGLFNTLGGVVGEMGLEEWSWIADDNKEGTILERPGYVKVGALSKHACLITPALKRIGTSAKADIKVSFMMAAYGGTDIEDAERTMTVRLLNGGSRASNGLLSGYSTISTSSEISIEGDGTWKEYSVTFTDVTPNCRIAFGGTRPGTGVQSRFMIDDIKIIATKVDVPAPIAGISGHITDTDGKPCAGISVSDGFSVAVTDSDGYYHLNPTDDCWYIYYSIPEYAKVEKDSYGRPAFFTRYSSTKKVYDFTITRQPVETEFALFAMADPQAHYAKRSPQTTADTDRFRLESVPAINSQIAASKLPCYGVTLGDIVYSEGSRNSNPGLTTMRSNFAMVDIPVFQTMGNHDYTYFYQSSNPLTTDATSSDLQLKVARQFEDCFGPVNLSFNRGNVHVVCMKNIYYQSTTDASKYICAFTDAQWEWFKADLANVPKSKSIILCVHIPLVGCNGSANTHVMDVMNLMKQYTNSTVFSGHTHYYRGVGNVNSTGMYEHIHSAVCGQWWWSNFEGDGCPNGYTIYDIDGTTIKDAYFIGVNDGMNTRDYQIRLYKGNITTGGSVAYFNWGLGANTLLINVFSGDTRWKVQVYENGVLKGNATMMANSKKTLNVTSGNTYDVPAGSNQDWWAIGYHIGVLGRGKGTSTSYYTNMFHMWKYTMTDANASVKVVATDPYGNQYTCTDVVTTGTSYPAYIKAAH